MKSRSISQFHAFRSVASLTRACKELSNPIGGNVLRYGWLVIGQVTKSVRRRHRTKKKTSRRTGMGANFRQPNKP